MSEVRPFTALSQSIVKTLLYYDLFNYPLKKEEVFYNLQSNHVTNDEVARELEKLKEANVLFQIGEFFSVHNDRALMDRRILGNLKAETFKAIAARRGRLIFQFPFVRAVMISGSLSKNYADDDTDVDFFIVTAPHRLWIARTLLVLYKRIFLFNSHKYFCVNYFIDEDHLEIEEKNLFTATELSTLLPLHGCALYDRFFNSNPWVVQMLPQAKQREVIENNADQNKLLKRVLEKILNSSLGNWMENKFMNLTQQRWKRLYATQLPHPDFEIAFKSNRHVSKNHPENYQRKVRERYEKRLEEFGLPLIWNWKHD